MGREVAVVSFRLGGHDGVSVEARKWARALHDLGFTTRRVAGVIEDGGAPDDTVLPALAIGADTALDPAALAAALDGADLVIIENLCSLPLNVDAARSVAKQAPTGKPPPSPLAIAMISGVIPAHSCANNFPVRPKPV